MKPCLFCGESCMSEPDDEGLLGSQIGNKMICSGCMVELKKALEIEK